MSGPELVWVLLRVAGLVALGALTVSVATGLAGPGVGDPVRRGVLVAIHRSSAIVGLSLTGAHVVLAVLDSYVDVPALAAVVPGVSRWEPVWVGVGAVALDLLVVVAVSSALRGRGPWVWWSLHVLTYPAWLLATAHALAVGTDATSSPYLAIGLAGVVAVGVAAAVRVMAVRSSRPVGVADRRQQAVDRTRA